MLGVGESGRAGCFFAGGSAQGTPTGDKRSLLVTAAVVKEDGVRV